MVRPSPVVPEAPGPASPPPPDGAGQSLRPGRRPFELRRGALLGSCRSEHGGGQAMTVHERPFGRYFEDFEVGDVYRHWPGKTITEADDHLFCMITMNHHPLHTDAW